MVLPVRESSHNRWTAVPNSVDASSSEKTGSSRKEPCSVEVGSVSVCDSFCEGESEMRSRTVVADSATPTEDSGGSASSISQARSVVADSAGPATGVGGRRTVYCPSPSERVATPVVASSARRFQSSRRIGWTRSRQQEACSPVSYSPKAASLSDPTV
jgi:hypothetical protein